MVIVGWLAVFALALLDALADRRSTLELCSYPENLRGEGAGSGSLFSLSSQAER